MELEGEFKQPEIGVIPENWSICTVGDKFSFKNGLNKEKKYFGYGTPIINFMDVFNNSGILSKNIKGKVFLSFDEIRNYKVELGDVLFTRTSEIPEEIGMSAVLLENIPKVVFSGFVLRGKPKDSTISNEFKKYCFRSNIVRKQIISTSSYTTRALTNGTLLSRVLFPLPPLPEQQAIAEVLSDTDSLIQSLEKLIAKKRLIKQGAMQELFTPRDGWTMKKLGDLFEITSSKRVFQSEWRDKGIPFYRARELAVLGEIGAIDNDLFITRSMYESFRKVYGVPKIGDMLVTGVGTLGKVYVVRDNHEFYFKDGNIIWFKINGSISTEYLRQLFLTPHIINQIENSSAGTTVGTYTISGAKKTVIPLPSTLKEQEYIADVLWSMDTEITALRKKLMKFRKLKQGLMQNLLTGKIRLV